jgi:pantothenate kinase type III
MTQPAQPPVLAIQVGNTRIKMAVFSGDGTSHRHQQA